MPSILPIRTLSIALLLTLTAHAQNCTPQSALTDTDRTTLTEASRAFAQRIQSNDAAFLRTASIAELQKNFGGLQYLVATTSPKLAGSAILVDQLYLLDASNLKPNADGSNPEGQFYCPLNHGALEADFDIPALPPGHYAFAIVNLTPAASAADPVAPYRLSLLLRQEQGRWLLAGFYPKPLTSGGHDGLWYWTQARELIKQKQPVNAWLYYQTAAQLLRPADFVISSHLDKLRTETTEATPPALADGVTPEAPLVLKSSTGTEYRFTSLATEDAPSQQGLNLVVHLRAQPDATPAPDPAAASTKRATDAAHALLAAYPELRKPFHGIRVFADIPNQASTPIDLPMAQLQ